MDILQMLIDALNAQVATAVAWLPSIGLFLVVLVILLTAASIVSRLTRRAVIGNRAIPDNVEVAIVRLIALVCYGSAFAASAAAVGVSVDNVLAAVGFLGLGATFASRVAFEHLFAGLILLARRLANAPMFFDEEYIEIGDAAGTVCLSSSNVLWTVLEQPDGKEIVVMNGVFMNDATLVRVGTHRMVVKEFDLNVNTIGKARTIMQLSHVDNPFTSGDMAFKVKPGTTVTGSGATYIMATEVLSGNYWKAYDWYDQNGLNEALFDAGCLSVFDIGGTLKLEGMPA